MLHRPAHRVVSLHLLAICFATLLASTASAQYLQFNLVANRRAPGVQAIRIDPNLINPWGLAFSASSPFWISDQGTGVATLYRHFGQIVPLVVTVPPATGGSIHGPTGQVYANISGQFMISGNGSSAPSSFIFDTLDGAISGWSGKTNDVVMVDNSSSGAVYTGLAIAATSSGAFLYAADNANRRVDMFDGTFTKVGELTDPGIPSDYAPYGVQAINGQIYVTYASFSKTGGYVDLFNADGTFFKTLISDPSGAHLDQPWGLALAPANFGQFSNDLLVGNVKGGVINAYDTHTWTFLGWLSRVNGQAIAIDGLWALEFGGGGVNNGKTNQLFFTAGPNGFADGLFGMIIPVGAGSPGVAP